MNAEAIRSTEFIGHYPLMSPKSSTVKPFRLTKAEGTVIARLKRGDEGAFDELVNQPTTRLSEWPWAMWPTGKWLKMWYRTPGWP